MAKVGAQLALPDPTYYQVCLNCYLTACHQDGLLKMYCPINASQKYRVPVDKVLELTKQIPTNRKWLFIQEVKKCAT